MLTTTTFSKGPTKPIEGGDSRCYPARPVGRGMHIRRLIPCARISRGGDYKVTMTPALFMRSPPQLNLGLQKKIGATAMPRTECYLQPRPALLQPSTGRVPLLNCQRKQRHNDLTAVADWTWCRASRLCISSSSSSSRIPSCLPTRDDIVYMYTCVGMVR